MFYLDTSLLVAAFTREASTDRLLDWLRRSRFELFVISEWVTTEFAAALSLKMRTGQLDETYRERASALFARTRAESMRSVVVTSAHFEVAARFAGNHGLGLRAGDALHLAIADDYDLTVCTLDRRMAAAGKTLGVSTRVL